MSTRISVPVEAREQRVVMSHVSWETYEGLLAANIDASSPRLTYNGGMLEIMSPSIEHERRKRILASIAELVAEENGMEFEDLGSATFRRQDLEKGVEPDACFYVQNADRIRGKPEIDLTADPPPDLVIEVEITSPTLSKLTIYASFGVPEIWLHDGHGVRILRLAGGRYESSSQSEVLPPLTESVLTEFVEQSKTLTTLPWRRVVRGWARDRNRQPLGRC